MGDEKQMMRADCAWCEVSVAAEVVAQMGHYDPETDPMPLRTSLVRCPLCRGPILLMQDLLYVDDADREHYDDPVRVFPPRDSHLNSQIPGPIRTAITEARRCFRAKANTAAAIMCRKAMEGVCTDHGKTRGSLFDRLEELKNDSTLDPRLYEWADQLRVAGNDAVHDVNVTVSREDAGDLLDLTVAVADYLYTFRAKFDDFKARRAAT